VIFIWQRSTQQHQFKHAFHCHLPLPSGGAIKSKRDFHLVFLETNYKLTNKALLRWTV